MGRSPLTNGNGAADAKAYAAVADLRVAVAERATRTYVDEQIEKVRTLTQQNASDISGINGQLKHHVTYRQLWSDWWKLVGIGLALVSAGAGLAIAGAQWLT